MWCAFLSFFDLLSAPPGGHVSSRARPAMPNSMPNEPENRARGRAPAQGVSACWDERTEGTGLEPVRACAQRFSRPPPYQLGLALPIAATELTRQPPAW